MNAVKELIHSLGGAIELEHRVMEYYKRAGDEANNRHDKALAHHLYAIEESHQIHIERLEARRDLLQRQGGNHFWPKALGSFGEAVADIVAGLPRDFIEGETFPTFATLIRYEERLIGYYQQLKQSADEETSVLLDSAIADCTANIGELQQMDSPER